MIHPPLQHDHVRRTNVPPLTRPFTPPHPNGFRFAGWSAFALLLAGAAFAAAAPADTSRTPAAAAPAIELRLPADIVYAHGGRADSAVTFRHGTHVMFAQNKCTGCHSAVFPMLKRGPAPNHRAMEAGGSCGLCHDGKQAFGVKDATACVTCHAGPQAAKPAAGGGADSASAAVRLPKPHTYPWNGNSPGKVTFRHKTHTKGAGDCASCHPKPFRMAAQPMLPDGAMHEKQACGACHDGKKSFATDDDAACSRCHRESGAQP